MSGPLFVVALVVGQVLRMVFVDASQLMAGGDQPAWQVGSCCTSVYLDVGLHSFPLVHPGQQGEKFRKLLGSPPWLAPFLSSRRCAALRQLVFVFMVVCSLYAVLAFFCFAMEVLVDACWAGRRSAPRVSLRLKAQLADGCGSATLDAAGEPHWRAGGGL